MVGCGAGLAKLKVLSLRTGTFFALDVNSVSADGSSAPESQVTASSKSSNAWTFQPRTVAINANSRAADAGRSWYKHGQPLLPGEADFVERVHQRNQVVRQNTGFGPGRKRPQIHQRRFNPAFPAGAGQHASTVLLAFRSK